MFIVGIYIINLRRTWEKLLLAARAIVAIEHPSEVFVISSRLHGQRAVLKFAAHTGATPIAGRFTPGAFTNQIQVSKYLHSILVLLWNVQYFVHCKVNRLKLFFMFEHYCYVRISPVKHLLLGTWEKKLCLVYRWKLNW